MPRLLILVPLTVALCACSQSRETYQQARYVPTSTEAVYSPIAQVGWEGSRQTYQLPTKKPAIEGDVPARIDCERPGPRFKPTSMVAWGLRPRDNGQEIPAEPLVGTSMERPAGEDTAIMHTVVVGMDSRPYVPGMSLDRSNPAVGGLNQRPRSTTGTGLDTLPVGRIVGFSERGNPYCKHDDSYGTLTVNSSAIDE